MAKKEKRENSKKRKEGMNLQPILLQKHVRQDGEFFPGSAATSLIHEQNMTTTTDTTQKSHTFKRGAKSADLQLMRKRRQNPSGPVMDHQQIHKLPKTKNPMDLE